MPTEKLVSLIIPTYNRAHLISITLKSIQAQTYTNWECLIIDDHSTDNTNEIISKYISKDSRFKYYLNNKKKGATGARNTGIEIAKGDFICFFDSDDIMYDKFLEAKISEFEKKPYVDVVTSFSHVLSADHNVIDTFCFLTFKNIFRDLLEGKTYVDTNSALIRRSLLSDCNIIWDEDCPSYQEWDFHLSLSQVGSYTFVPEFLTGYYRRNHDTISSDMLKDLEGRLFIVKKYKNHFLREFSVSDYKRKYIQLLEECEKFQIDINSYIESTEIEKEITREFKRQEINKKRKSVILRVLKLLKLY
jgi:glycosyltransferase involved in cell wall biosynthesis